MEIGWDINIVEPSAPKATSKVEVPESATLYQVVYRWKNAEDDVCEIVMATSMDEEETIENLTKLMEKYGEDGEDFPLDTFNGGSIRKRGGPYMARFRIRYIVGRSERQFRWKSETVTLGPVVGPRSMREMKDFLMRHIREKYGTEKLVEQGVMTEKEAQKFERNQLPNGTKIWAV